MPSVRTAAAFAHLVAELRARAETAAGPDRLVSRKDQRQLEPFLDRSASAMRAEQKGARIGVDALVARAGADAAAAWAAANTKGPAYISKAEVAAIGQADPALGLITARAVASARPQPAAAPAIVVATATPGVEVSVSGDVFTVRADASVPVQGTVVLTVDGAPIELRRAPDGLRARAQDASVPEGYGAEVLSSGTAADGRAEAAVRITKDPAGWLSRDQALTVARTALREHIEHERVHAADWKASFGLSWSQAVAAGVLGQIEAFGGSPTAEIVRRPDRFVFVDRGPLDLYTEVSVRKHDGHVLNVYVEID